MSVPLPTRRCFTVDEYYRMTEVGILGADERVELIEGEIVEMASIGSRHAACVNRFTRIFVRGVGEAALVAIQNPVRLSDLSEPVPDVAVLRPRPDDYAEAHPGPSDVLLLVEVADSTVSYDRDRKAPLYAVAGIAEYWLVDVVAAAVEVYRRPSAGGYEEVDTYREGDTLRPIAFPELAVPVVEVLPAAP
ncbi:MAG TPA: Uma2 family endonuclease [Longimicrobiales bacterium]